MKKLYRDKIAYEFYTIFSPPIYAVFSREALKNLLQDRGIPEGSESDLPHALGWVSTYKGEAGGDVYVVFVDGEQAPKAVLSTIVHESVHVAQNIEKYVGTTFDPETEAYLTEYISTCIKHAWEETLKEEAKK